MGMENTNRTELNVGNRFELFTLLNLATQSMSRWERLLTYLYTGFCHVRRKADGRVGHTGVDSAMAFPRAELGLEQKALQSVVFGGTVE